MKNVASEMAIIGSLIIDAKKSVPKLLESILPEYFSEQFLGRAYTEGIEMFSKRGCVDFNALLHKFAGEYDEEECKSILSQCANQGFLMDALPSHIKAVTECYKSRELRKICSPFAFTGDVYMPGVDHDLEQIAQRVGELLRKKEKKGLSKISDITLEQYVRLFDKDLLKDRIKTGFHIFDSIIKGILKKNLVILAARPGVGKSAMALNLSINIAKQGKQVALYSLEMGNEEIFERFMANLAPVNMGVLQDREFGDDTAAMLAKATDKIYKLPIYISDSGYQTTQSIRTEVQLKKIDVVVIDYLQLLTPVGRSENRNTEIEKITRELKCMAQDLDISVILLSQLNRENGETDEPTLRALRGSGSIEQDANMVWFMWLNGEQQNQPVKEIAFRCAKNRNGMTGDVVLLYTGALMKFEETNFVVNREKRRASKGAWQEE